MMTYDIMSESSSFAMQSYKMLTLTTIVFSNRLVRQTDKAGEENLLPSMDAINRRLLVVISRGEWIYVPVTFPSERLQCPTRNLCLRVNIQRNFQFLYRSKQKTILSEFELMDGRISFKKNNKNTNFIKNY